MTATALATSAYARSRAHAIDLKTTGVGRHTSAALLEVDVTHARRAVRAANRGGDSPVSLLAWLIRCVAGSLREHPSVRVRGRRGRLRPSATGVDVSVMVDRTIDGIRLALPVLLESVDSATPSQIERTITRARSESSDPAAFIAGRVHRVLPQRLRRAYLRFLIRRPRRLYRGLGTVVVTSLGMGGRIRGWFIPRSLHPLQIGVGAVTQKAMVHNGTIVSREMLHLAIMVDYGAIDESAASRWVSDLVRTLEHAKNLQM